MDTIQRYQDIERAYQQKYRQRIERQIKIGKVAIEALSFLVCNLILF